jgi:hypothetical protein
MLRSPKVIFSKLKVKEKNIEYAGILYRVLQRSARPLC